MIYRVVTLLLLPVTVGAYAHQQADTLRPKKMLQEIVVEAPSETTYGNKTTFRPAKKAVEAANSAVQLLSFMQIPALIVNPATGDISLPGGKSLSLRINGRPASQRDVAALNPKEILRVEFINNPGLRYGNADAVADIITRKPGYNGYSIYTNLLQSPNRGWGDYSVALKHSRGASQWSADYHSNPMWQMDCYRDNTERTITPSGREIISHEYGRRIPNRMVTHRLALQYSLTQGRNCQLNIQGRLFRTNDRYRSAGEIHSLCDGKETVRDEYEENPVKSWQADLDIYFFWKLGKRHSFCLNLVPSVITSSSEHILRTDTLDINNAVSNRGMRLLAEGWWEVAALKGRLTTGFRSVNAWDHLRYRPGELSSRQFSTQNHIFAEYRRDGRVWQWSISAGAVAHHAAATHWRFWPRGSVHYSPTDRFGIGLYLDATSRFPSVNELNGAFERIDAFKWSRGNRGLRPFGVYSVRLVTDLRAGDIPIQLSVADEYAERPIVQTTAYVGDLIMKQPENTGSNNMLELKGNVRWPLFQNLLTLSAEAGWHTFRSRSPHFSHRYSQPFCNLQLTLLKGGWWAMVKYNSTYNRLWGEMITSSNQNLLNIGIGYTLGPATFMGGLVNPAGNVAIRSRDLSAIAGFDRTYQAAGSNRLVWLGVTLSLHRGKNRASIRKRLDNSTQYETITNSTK